MGWYDPADGPFDFARVYAAEDSLVNPSNTVRHEMVQWALDACGSRIGKADLMRILRWHYEGTEYDLSEDYAISPHSTDARTVCRLSTEVSIVAQLRGWLPSEIGGVMWMSLKTPCSSVYVPWYMGITRVPEAFTIGTDKATEGSAYWAFRDLAHYVDNHYAETYAAVQSDWSLFEGRLFSDQAKVERRALALYAGDPAAAAEYLTTYSGKAGMRSVRHALLLRETVEEFVKTK